MPFEVPGGGFSTAPGFQSHDPSARQVGIAPGATLDAENLAKIFNELRTKTGRRVAYSAMLAGARVLRPSSRQRRNSRTEADR